MHFCVLFKWLYVTTNHAGKRKKFLRILIPDQAVTLGDFPRKYTRLADLFVYLPQSKNAT